MSRGRFRNNNTKYYGKKGITINVSKYVNFHCKLYKLSRKVLSKKNNTKICIKLIKLSFLLETALLIIGREWTQFRTVINNYVGIV